MKYTPILLFVLGAHASWFGSDTPAYQGWDTHQLKAWLDEHNIAAPSATSRSQLQDIVKNNWAAAQQYGADQYHAAQHSFQNMKDSMFDTWDESTLRQFLLDQGIVAPSGSREQLVQLAKQKYNDYERAMSFLSSRMSTGIYGSPAHQMTQSVSSAVAQATNDVSRKFDDTKDYVYSTWDDNRLRSFLESKGVLKSNQQATRERMLQMMHEYYAKTTDPVWETWSDSYMHQWLVDHGIIAPSTGQPSRLSMIERMKLFYYDITQKVWHTWSDSQLKNWLVEHDVIKSDAQVNREKLEKLVADNYLNASDSVWGAWRDSNIRAWLVEHGYISEEKANKMSRSQLVKLIDKKYTDISARTSPYLVWPDARLRAYLREQGISEESLPTSRPGLLQEVRIRYVQTSSRAEHLFQRIRDILNSSIEIAEEKLSQVIEILTGTGERAKERAEEGQEYVTDKAKSGIKSGASEVRKGAQKIETEL